MAGVIALIGYYILFWKKEKITKSDKFLEIGLITLLIFFFTWMFIGFNKTLSKITLMYFSPAPRTQIVFSMVAVMLVFMLIKKFENRKILDNRIAIFISLSFIALLYILIRNSSYGYLFTTFKLEIVLVVMFGITYSILILNKKSFCYIMCMVAIVAGATINPINFGMSILNDTKIAKEIQSIEQENPDAIWIGRYNWSGQYLLANGVNTISGVNNYPNFKWLRIVDPEGIYNDVYNRYAHINIILAEKTEFKLISTDAYEAYLTYDNLKDLNIKYYYTDVKYSNDTMNEFHLMIKYENKDNNQYIYQIN